MATEIKEKFRDDLIRETNPGDVLIERSYYGARFGSETKVFETAHEIASKAFNRTSVGLKFKWYSASLDSMAMIQDAMSKAEMVDYVEKLGNITLSYFQANPSKSDMLLVVATAAQRCEAAVRALGLWSDE